jgi:2-oxoglutarate ferredoxin oxidoreductase subunit alpha
MPGAGHRRVRPGRLLQRAVIEAFTIAVEIHDAGHFLLSDGYIANGAEPWLIPDVVESCRRSRSTSDEKRTTTRFMPYKRERQLARPWAIPGTPGLEHRIGGLEKQDVTGSSATTRPITKHGPPPRRQSRRHRTAGADLLWTGPETGDVLLIGWGGTFGAIKAATLELRRAGIGVSAVPPALSESAAQALGQPDEGIQARAGSRTEPRPASDAASRRFLVDAKGLNKVKRQPFIHEIVSGANRPRRLDCMK